MSRKRASSGGRSKGPSWSGLGAREAPRHRWQDQKAFSRGRLPKLQRPKRWFVVAVMGLGLIAFLVYLVLKKPSTTPVIAVAATTYEFPVPINDWALEDRDALSSLSNLVVHNLSDKWNKDGGNAKDIIPKGIDLHRGAPLIVYISMHGIVSNEGEPCLLPPNASIDDVESWIRVADVLDELESFAPDRNRLLILDCSRLRVAWNVGYLYNTFAERIEKLVEKRARGSEDSQLAVLISAAPAQTNRASANLAGSAFGRYLQLGLAGAADQDSGLAWSHDVTLFELSAYLQREVAAWSLANRGEPQTPVLLPKDIADFRVAYGAGSRTVRRLEEQLHFSKPHASPITADELKQLWDHFENLRNKYELVRWNPVACREFEHKLLRLEKMASGGAAYAKRAKEDLEELQDQLNRVPNDDAELSNSLGSRLDIASNGSNWARISDASHSLPSSEYFGACEQDRARSVRELCESLCQPATDVESLILKGAEKDELAWNLSETQVLASARRQKVFDLWPQSYEVLNTLRSLRDTSERLAVPQLASGGPGDERAHYYTRVLAEQGDTRRRQAEDILFVGERNAGDNDYDKLAKRAMELCERISSLSDDATAAWKSRDNALAETPYLAEWLCNPLTIGLPDRDDFIEEKLVPLIQATRRLGEEIDQHITDRDYAAKEVHPPFHELAEQVRSGHEAVKNAFDDELVDLIKGLNTAKRLAAIEAALAVPLIKGETRKVLHEQCAQISTELHKEYFRREAGGGHGTSHESTHVSMQHSDEETSHKSTPATSANYLEHLGRWKPHPLLEILQIPSPTTEDPLKWCEVAGDAARNEIAEAHEVGTGSPVSATGDAIARKRQPLGRGERRFRAMAALGHAVPPENENPINVLRKFDLQQLLLWLAGRAMDDFWVGITDRGGEPPFFARVAEDYIASAEMIGPEVADQIDASRALLAKRWNEKTKNPVRIKIAADSNLVMADGDDAAVLINVAHNSDVVDSYPQGIAAVYLRNGTERQSDVLIEGVPPNSASYAKMPLEQGAPQAFNATVRDTTKVDVLEAAAFFRGHEDRSDFIVPKLQGRSIVYSPHRYKSQSITLIGDEEQRSSIMIVVDCSGSMSEFTADRAEVGGASNLRQRMELAKEAVNTMLNELARRNANIETPEDIHVGVRLYGHRLIWTKTPPFTIQRQAKYLEFRPIPDNLAPSADIELIHPTGRFDDTDAKNVRVLLEKVEPWGLTPLYRALVDSLHDFSDVDPDSRREIIAITDGENYVWAPTKNSPVPEPREIHKEDVLQAWNEHNVPIHILGFDLRTTEGFSISAAGVQQAKSDYQDIANRTGGSYSDVSSGSQLLGQLRSRLARDRYVIREAARRSEGSTTTVRQSKSAKLNEAVAIRLPNRQPKEFSVDFRGMSKDVVLEGGEAIQLYVADDGRDIIAEPYPPPVEVEKESRLTTGASATSDEDYILRVQRPQKNKENITFRMAVQRDPLRTHFTKRPVESWVEITPVLDGGGEQEPYVFYDNNLEPDTTAPALKCVASSWPQSAKQARIRYWCKFAETRAQKFPLRQVLDSPAKFREFSVEGLDGVKFKIEIPDKTERLIYVEERHDKGSPVFDSARVQFESDRGIQPSVVRRQFDAEHGIVTHSFSFLKDEVPQLDAFETARICIANTRAVKEGAMRVPTKGGLLVGIAGDDALFSPAAASAPP